MHVESVRDCLDVSPHRLTILLSNTDIMLVERVAVLNTCRLNLCFFGVRYTSLLNKWHMLAAPSLYISCDVYRGGRVDKACVLCPNNCLRGSRWCRRRRNQSYARGAGGKISKV